MIEPTSILTIIAAWLAIKGIEFLGGLGLLLMICAIFFWLGSKDGNPPTIRD